MQTHAVDGGHSGGTIAGAVRGGPTPATKRQTWGTIGEVVVTYGLLEGALWTLGQAQLMWSLGVACWVVFCTLRSRQTAESAGVALQRFWRGFWVVPASVVIAAVMLLAGWLAGSIHDLHGARTPMWHAVLYGVWALVQQFLTQSFIFVRLENVLGGRRAVFIAGLLFCAAHVPNPVLMAATMGMGLGFSELFRRYRNIYPLAIAHAVLGLALAVALPETATHHMRVGIAWWK